MCCWSCVWQREPKGPSQGGAVLGPGSWKRISGISEHGGFQPVYTSGMKEQWVFLHRPAFYTHAPRSCRPHKAVVLPRFLAERGGYVKALGPKSQATSYARRPHVEQSVSQAAPWAFIKKSLAESGRIHCGFCLIAALPHLYASLNTLPTRLYPPH